GRSIHPVAGLPGGWSRPITAEERDEFVGIAKKNIEFALFTLQVFEDIVLKNPAYVDLITSDIYSHETYYMGLVDDRNRTNFYDGMVRVVGPDGTELVKYHPSEYTSHIAERVEPW